MPPESLDDLGDDFGWLLEAAEAMNEYRPPETVRVPREQGGGSLPGHRPGDDFNRRAGWDDVLPRHGWKAVGRSGEKVYWRRPGKDHGWSATTGYCRSDLRGDLLYVFTTSAPPFESEQAYSKFEAYTYLEHGGDWSAAAESLAAAGWGPQAARISPSRPAAPAPPPGPGAPAVEDFSFSRVPFSALRLADEKVLWLWKGYLARNGITLLSALWKVGKTTLLAHLLKAFEAEGDFCGLPVAAARVLYVTEEHESLWAGRRDALGIGDHCEAIVRPFAQRPSMAEWMRFLNDLQRSLAARPADLVVFDTISNLWPVRDENDAAKVGECLQPLRAVAENTAFKLIHHMRKSDGTEATGSRGSGALPAFCDILLELRRHSPADPRDRKRVLTGYGRYDPPPDEMVIELSAPRLHEGTLFPPKYVAHGKKTDVAFREAAAAVENVLPRTAPGYTWEQVAEGWPEGAVPSRAKLQAVLRRGTEEGLWVCAGEGKRGSPHLYWRPREVPS